MYGSVENLIEIEVGGTPLAERLSDAQISQILAAPSHVFASFVMPTGELPMTIRAHLVMGRKPWAQFRSRDNPISSWPDSLMVAALLIEERSRYE